MWLRQSFKGLHVNSDKAILNFNLQSVKSIVGDGANRHRLWIRLWTTLGSQLCGQQLDFSLHANTLGSGRHDYLE